MSIHTHRKLVLKFMFIPSCFRISFFYSEFFNSVFSFQLDSDALDDFATELSKNHNFDRGEVRDV